MGWRVVHKPNGHFAYRGKGELPVVLGYMDCSLPCWNPFADPEGLGPIREIEARLSEEQWQLYIYILERKYFDKIPLNMRRQFRHASPAICAEALARVFEPGRFE